MSNDAPRIDVDTARELTEAGRALLVCAYDDDDKCRSMLLEGAMTWPELEAALDQIEDDREIVLYCA